MSADSENLAQGSDAEQAPAASQAVVVGVDGSTSSAAAARWAADEAARRDLPLRVLHVVPAIAPGVFPVALATAAIDWQSRADTLLHSAMRPIRERHPGLRIEALGTIGRPPAAVLTEDAQAELLVVGSRGGGGFADLLLGSTAIQVLERATAPVVVVRPSQVGDTVAAGGPVVVGVDGSEPSQRALRFAFAEASLRRTTLTAVHAWAVPDHPGLASLRAAAGVDWSSLAREGAEILGGALTAVRGDFSDVAVTEHVVDERPVPALLEASRGAQLLVVGSRGRGTLAGLVLGSVSHSVTRGADCPVAVVR